MLVGVGGDGGADGGGGQLAVFGRAGDALVAGGFHRAGLMDADVAARRGDDRLIRAQEGRDGGGVGLGAPHQEMDVGVRPADGRLDQRPGPGRVGVGGVAGVALAVGGGDGRQDGGVGPLAVVVGEADHDAITLPWNDSVQDMTIITAFHKNTIGYLLRRGACCAIL